MQNRPVFQGTLNNSAFSSTGFEKKPLPTEEQIVTGYEKAVSFS